MYVIYIFVLVVMSSAQDIQIYKNELSNQMEEHAIGKALLILEESNSNEIIAKSLANEMNIKFGKQWMSFVGLNLNETGLGIDHQKNSLIWFSYKQKNIVLFKPLFELSSDPIVEARKDNAKIIYVNVGMEEYTRLIIINATKSALKNFDNFKDISLNISKTLKSSLGNDWRVIIDSSGLELNSDLYNNISIPKSMISIQIESIHFVIFRFSSITNNNNKINFADILENARKSEFIVGYVDDASIFNLIKNSTKQVLSQNFPNCVNNHEYVKEYSGCIRDISVAMKAAIESYMKGEFTVTVGKPNQCFAYHSIGGTSFLFYLGDLYFEIVKKS